jgi:hypothetical protein
MEDLEDNVYYSPNLAKMFLKKHVPFLPLMTKELLGVGFTAETFTRPNNGNVESWNKIVKSKVVDNSSLGKITVMNYMRKMKVHLYEYVYRMIEFKINVKTRACKTKKDDPKESVENLKQ